MTITEKLLIAKTRTEAYARGINVVFPDELEWQRKEQERKELLKDYFKTKNIKRHRKEYHRNYMKEYRKTEKYREYQREYGRRRRGLTKAEK